MTKKVLLADDEEDLLALVSATLGNDDRYHLLLARNGEEAVRAAIREQPDLLFLDVMMPGMDGFEVCRFLKGKTVTYHVKIIMLTALAQDFDRQKAMEAGAHDYFSKPFSPTALLEKVEELLAAPELVNPAFPIMTNMARGSIGPRPSSLVETQFDSVDLKTGVRPVSEARSRDDQNG